jgi:hypothetical protein
MLLDVSHNWSLKGPGGHYGLIEMKTGPGWLDANTFVELGPPARTISIPLPIHAIVALVFVVVMFGLCIRAWFRKDERAT